jgi:hypothetical protein
MQRAICRGIFAPAQPDFLAASVRDFLSGAYTSPWDMVGYTATSLTTITNIYGKHIRSHLKGVAAALDAK